MEDLLRRAYDAFERRDIDSLLADMTEDVSWPNVAAGTHVTGHDAVRAYWTAQWEEIDPHVTPVAITPLGDGAWDVEVHQVVRSLAGEVLRDGTVHHAYAFREGKVARMDVRMPT